MYIELSLYFYVSVMSHGAYSQRLLDLEIHGT